MTPLDSLEGIKLFMEAARSNGFVVSTYHEKIAQKYGVSTEGVRVNRQLSVGDRVPMPPKEAPRPAFTGAGKTSFKPARKK